MSDYFIFDDIDTRNFDGIYVFFDDVDRTPKRVYTEVPIPARNGSFFIDEKRYEDVDHVYHIMALTKEAENALVNALSSKKGYHRLEDSFNPDEFYSAVFTSGADPKISSSRDKNTFKVTFTRKPQRFLKSGDEPITVSNGSTITNPTLFDAQPMLEVEGYGDIGINGEIINIENTEFGAIPLSEKSTKQSVTLDVSKLNTGDEIYSSSERYPRINLMLDSARALRIEIEGSATNGTAIIGQSTQYDYILQIQPRLPNIQNGTDASVVTTVHLHIVLGTTEYNTLVRLTTTYTASTNTISMAVSYGSDFPSDATLTRKVGYMHEPYYGNSTKTLIPTPLYIDLEIGEAYGNVSGEVLSFDNLVVMPTELPVLKAGANEITYDNTVTDLKVIPRWWKV